MWLLVDQFSKQGRVYAGWTAGVQGARYLLAAWFSYLKSRCTNFTKLVRRKRPPRVPYYLRGVDKDAKARLTFNDIRHEFDDDLAQTAHEYGEDEIELVVRQRVDAIAWLVVGAVMLVWSLF